LRLYTRMLIDLRESANPVQMSCHTQTGRFGRRSTSNDNFIAGQARVELDGRRRRRVIEIH
jgi:hypothetical protein